MQTMAQLLATAANAPQRLPVTEKSLTATRLPTSKAPMPVQPTCNLCAGVGFLMPNLPLHHPDFGKAIPCTCRQQANQQRKAQKLQRLGSLYNQEQLTFANFIVEPSHLSTEQKYSLRRAYDICRYYAENPDGWIFMQGGYGCGKTHLAAAIANERIAAHQPALFMLTPDLLDHLRATFSPTNEVTYDELFTQVRNTPLLILDDLGTQTCTPWTQEKLFQLINHRYTARLPTVVTTNQRLDDIEPRIRSRLMDMQLVNDFIILAPDFRSGKNALESSLGELGLHDQKTFASFNVNRPDLAAAERLNLKKIFDICSEYARQPEGWLILMGGHGCGKTHLAAAIANQQSTENRRDSIFTFTANLLDHLRATFAPQSATSYDRRFDEIKKTSLLILDDLGTESATPWAKEKLLQLLNHRYNANLPTIITTFAKVSGSAGPNDLQINSANIDPWLQSRVQNTERCKVCAIRAPGYRILNKQNGGI